MPSSIDSLTSTEVALRKQIRRWREDPVAFVRKAFNAEPTEQQAAIMRAFAKPGAKVTIKAGHGVGKTTTEAWMGMWQILLFGDSKVAVTAPSKAQLRDVLMAEIGKQLENAHPWVREQFVYSTMRLEVKGRESSQFLTARTARPEQPDALQGLHARNMAFIVDEAFGVADSIFEVARGALSTENSRVMLCGNPTATSGYAYETHHRHRDSWNRFTLSCVDSPLATKLYVEEMKAEYGEDSDMYRVRVLGEFPNASITQFISSSLVDGALGKHLRPDEYSWAPKVLGVDVAWFGDDRSVIVLRQGLAATILGQWRKLDTMTLAGLVAQFEDKYRADAVMVDATGVGAGVVDRLRQLGRSPLAVMLGGASTDAQYFNKRTQTWGDMRSWLAAGGAIPKDDDLRTDLVGPMFSYTPTGKVQLERKTDMKKRGQASPDLGDALALTFADTVYVAPKDGRGVPVPARAETDYDLWSR